MKSTDKQAFLVIISIAAIYALGSFAGLFILELKNKSCIDVHGYKIKTKGGRRGNGYYYSVYPDYKEESGNIKARLVHSGEDIVFNGANVISITPCKGN